MEAKVSHSQSIVFTGPNSGNFSWTIHNKSKLLLFGYIKQVIGYHKPPTDIIKVCVTFVDNRLSQILNATNGEVFESKPFKMAKLDWIIQMYPNGTALPVSGSVIMYLKLLSMPNSVRQIRICMSILCTKSRSSFTRFATVNNSSKEKNIITLRQKALLLSEWKSMKFNTLSILVTVKILRIILFKHTLIPSPFICINIGLNIPKKYHFKYEINSTQINAFKNSYNGKIRESEIMNNMWKMAVSPNGTYNEQMHNQGWIGVFLKLCDIPAHVNSISTKFCISCIETKKSFIYTHNLGFRVQSWGNRKFMRLADITTFKLNKLTLVVDIEILNVKLAEFDELHVYDAAQINKILSK